MQGDTNVEISFRRNITVSHSTGAAEHLVYTDEEDSSGVQVSSGSQDEDDDEYTDSEEEGYDWIEEDEIEPSDSASRPRVRHVTAPQVPTARAKSTHRRPSRKVPVQDAPSHHSHSHSRSRSRHALDHEHAPRRRRRRSVHSDDLDAPDDYPGYGARPGPPPHHPSAQWSHVQGAPSGYAPSIMSDPRYTHNPFQGGAAPPTNQLVPFGSPNHYAYDQNPFAPGQQNPFAPGQGPGPNGYYEPGGRRGHRNSMPPVPSGEMMPYYNGYYPYGVPPYGLPPGMPPPMYPYHGPPHTTPPPPHPPSKKGTPAPPPEAVAPPPPPPPPVSVVVPAPPPPIQMPLPPPPPPPPDTAKEDGMLTKLEKLLLGKQELEEKKAEDAKFSRLEQLLVEQQKARIEKDLAKKKAAEEAAIKAAEAKKKGDEDKLAKLEKLILAQKDEQLKREAAQEAARLAEKADADAKAAKAAAEKAAAAKAAAELLEAAKKAREEAEAKAAKEAEETKAAHEKAMAEAKAAAEELEKAKKAAEEEAKKLKPSDAPKPPIKFKDAVGRKFSFPWHLCKTWKVRDTTVL